MAEYKVVNGISTKTPIQVLKTICPLCNEHVRSEVEIGYWKQRSLLAEENIKELQKYMNAIISLRDKELSEAGM